VRNTLLIGFGLVLIVAGVASSVYADDYRTSNDLRSWKVLKDAMPHGKPVYAGRVGGEDIANAVAIPALPFTDSGNTCNFLNDYDEVCPYEGSISSDVVYSFIPPYSMEIDLSLCNSSYDTKLYVRDATGTTLACNDDFCSGPNYGFEFLSFIGCLPVNAGQVYYIFVDGYGTFGDCGEYILDVTECGGGSGCDLTCPDGAHIEQEPVCIEYWDDIWNTGCNGPNNYPPGPEVFELLLPECDGTLTVCGTSGTKNHPEYGDWRDTDWYEIHVSEAGLLNMCICAEFNARVFIIDGNLGCSGFTILTQHDGLANQETCFEYPLTPGTYWVWVGPQVFVGLPCGLSYVFTLDGYFPPGGPSATERSSWGTIKNQYKR
jgi:hypothetical protein